MNYTFDWSVVANGAPYVTISSISISFNDVSANRLGKPESIMIGFDEDNLVLGIKPYAGETGIKPYLFASRQRNGWVRIGCKDFIQYLGSLLNCNFNTARKYVAKYDKESGYLIVDLKQAQDDTKSEE